MADTKDIFLNEDLRIGGFYELSIQVCASIDNDPIKKYTDYLWSLKNIDGPYDKDFHKIPVDINTFRHEGILHLDNFSIPIISYNIRETEPIETGFNWFDICFYTAAIEKVFGPEYITWTENPNCPELLYTFFMNTMKKLYELYPFELAFIDFECSGRFYLDDLKNEMEGFTTYDFFIGRQNQNLILEKYRKFVKVIN